MSTTRKHQLIVAALGVIAACGRGGDPAPPTTNPPDDDGRGGLSLGCAGAVMSDDRSLNEITIRCPGAGDHAGLVTVTRVTCAEGSQVTAFDGASGSARVWCRRRK
jgi:hypothetical protein